MKVITEYSGYCWFIRLACRKGPKLYPSELENWFQDTFEAPQLNKPTVSTRDLTGRDVRESLDQLDAVWRRHTHHFKTYAYETNLTGEVVEAHRWDNIGNLIGISNPLKEETRYG